MKRILFRRIMVCALILTLTSALYACGVGASAAAERTETIEDEETAKAASVIGKKVSFLTYDMNQNLVASEDIFAQCDITMINVWATWCGFCCEELPELENINDRLQNKNCQIIGIVGDLYDDDTYNEALSLLSDAGVTYTNLFPWDGCYDTFNMDEGWPTSFFVNRNGEMVGEPICGAMVDQYEEYIDALLANMDSAPSKIVRSAQFSKPRADMGAKTGKGYNIIVVDQNNNPVEGAMIQFCANDTCKMAITDADGTVTFEDPEGVYDVHILKAPAGYKQNTEDYKTESTYADLTIVLEKE